MTRRPPRALAQADVRLRSFSRAAITLAIASCAAAPRPPEAPRVVVVPEELELVIAENASVPATLLRDCDLRAECIGVQGVGADPTFDPAWLGDDLPDTRIMNGPWCHGRTDGVFSSTWQGVSHAVRVVAETLARHDSGALVPVCIQYPSIYL